MLSGESKAAQDLRPLRQPTAAPAKTVAETAALTVTALVLLAWGTILLLILSHPIFVTNDSLNNYAHVWFISDRLWSHMTPPLRMDVLYSGEAYACPYSCLPWFTAALVRPALGDWTVTLWLVLGFALVVYGGLRAFPELRQRPWLAAFLLSPGLVEGVLLGQLPFLWASGFFFLAIAAWRRHTSLLAGALAGVAIGIHPPLLLPIALVIAGAAIILSGERRSFVLSAAVAATLAAPFVVLSLVSPTVGNAGPLAAALSLLGTVGTRSALFIVPFLLLALKARGYDWRVVVAALLVINVAVIPPRSDAFAWGALFRQPDASLEAFIASSDFERGAVYRILRVADGKVGMYQLIRGGARLDSEFFPESIERRSFASEAEYAAFLERRKVQWVIIYNAYDRRYGTNEHTLLEEMASNHRATDGICISRIAGGDEYDVYRVRPPDDGCH